MVCHIHCETKHQCTAGPPDIPGFRPQKEDVDFIMMAHKLLAFCLLAAMLLACGACKEEVVDSMLNYQHITTSFEGGLLQMVVEADNTVYQFDEYIHVTATLINYSGDDMSFVVPTSTPNVHQELQVDIRNGDDTLMDVDMHLATWDNVPTTFTLAPGEKYVQVMRFSTRHYNGYAGNWVMAQDTPVDGHYTGTVTAMVILDGEEVPFTTTFTIDILPKTRY